MVTTAEPDVWSVQGHHKNTGFILRNSPPPSHIPHTHTHTHTHNTAPVEVDIIRREYGENLPAYGSLGVLTVNVTIETYHYLVLITGCQSVGKVSLTMYLHLLFVHTVLALVLQVTAEIMMQ